MACAGSYEFSSEMQSGALSASHGINRYPRLSPTAAAACPAWAKSRTRRVNFPFRVIYLLVFLVLFFLENGDVVEMGSVDARGGAVPADCAKVRIPPLP